MSGINSGILYNATPLTEDQEGQLQKEVVADQKAFAYLNSNKELCFALPHDPRCIKELAWDHAQHWYISDGVTIRMDDYRKSDVDTHYLYQRYYCQAPDDVVSTLPKIPMDTVPSSYPLGSSTTSSGFHITGCANNSIPDSGILYIPALVAGAKLTHINGGAFVDCDRLRYINIPPTITEIGGYAFANCPNLVEIDLGNCEADIVSCFVNSGSSLTTFSVGATNKKYSTIDGVLFTADKTTLLRFPSARAEYICPEGTQRIASHAFVYCDRLTSVVIPVSVTHIDSGAFEYISSALTTLIYAGTKRQWDNIIKQSGWLALSTKIKYVQCSDGTITL